MKATVFSILARAQILTVFFPSPALAADGFVWGFSKGLRPLGSVAGGHESDSATCGACHPKQFAEWSKSKHSQSWNSEVFHEGFSREPRLFCVHCHAPTNVEPSRLRSLRREASDEGISCRVCHVRGDRIITASDTGSLHKVFVAPELGTSAFCANCHEFNPVHETTRPVGIIDVPMQSTYSEWLEYSAAGGKASCQTCHMPEGSHEFAGVRDSRFIGDAISIWVKASGYKRELVIENTGAGHAIPTGDVFRALVLELQDTSGSWSKAAEFRKRYDVRFEAGKSIQYIAEDNRLFFRLAQVIPLHSDYSAYRLRFMDAPSRSRIVKFGSIH